MPISVSIDKTNDLILRTITGVVSMDEVVASVDAVVSSPDYHPGMKSLTDLRGLTHSATLEDMKKLALAAIRHSQRAKGNKLAIVVPEAVSYGMLRMFQAHIDHLPMEVALFREMPPAREWLGLPA
jgi:hypothetical protein